MTELQGNYLTNSVFVVWLLQLMESTYPVDANTAAATSAAVAKNLSDAAYMQDTRRFVAERMPNKKQRACALSHQLDCVVPGLQATLDTIRSAVTQANEAQTEVLGTKLEGFEERLMAKLDGIQESVTAKVDGVEERVMVKVDGALAREFPGRSLPPDEPSRHVDRESDHSEELEELPDHIAPNAPHFEELPDNGDFMRCPPNASHLEELPDHIPLDLDVGMLSNIWCDDLQLHDDGVVALLDTHEEMLVPATIDTSSIMPPAPITSLREQVMQDASDEVAAQDKPVDIDREVQKEIESTDPDRRLSVAATPTPVSTARQGQENTMCGKGTVNENSGYGSSYGRGIQPLQLGLTPRFPLMEIASNQLGLMSPALPLLSSVQPKTSGWLRSLQPQTSTASDNICDHHFSFFDVEWNATNQVVQFAHQVTTGDGNIVCHVVSQVVKPRDVNSPLYVTPLTIKQLNAGIPLTTCHAAIREGLCGRGTAVSHGFQHDFTVISDDLAVHNLQPIQCDGICSLSLARHIFRLTNRPLIKFSLTNLCETLGIFRPGLTPHLADDDVILGSLAWTELLRIAKVELQVVTMDELRNLADYGQPPDSNRKRRAPTVPEKEAKQRKSLSVSTMRTQGSAKAALPDEAKGDATKDKTKPRVTVTKEDSKRVKKRATTKGKRKHDDVSECDDGYSIAAQTGHREDDDGDDDQEDTKDPAEDLAVKRARKENRSRTDLATSQRHLRHRDLIRQALKNTDVLDAGEVQNWFTDTKARCEDKTKPYMADILGSKKNTGRLICVRGMYPFHLYNVFRR